jgi:hypothetical protein
MGVKSHLTPACPRTTGAVEWFYGQEKCTWAIVVNEDRSRINRVVEDAHLGSARQSAPAPSCDNPRNGEKTGAFDQAEGETDMRLVSISLRRFGS